MRPVPLTVAMAVVLLSVFAMLPTPAAAAALPTVYQLNDQGQMIKLDGEELVGQGVLGTQELPLPAPDSHNLAPYGPASQDSSAATLDAGYVSGSLYPSSYGCGVAFKAQASGWGSGSGTIEVTLYQNGNRIWNDSRDFSGSDGSYPLTDLSCGQGSFELYTNVVHTNGADTDATTRVIAC